MSQTKKAQLVLSTMEAVFLQAKSKADFSMTRIARIAGVSPSLVRYYGKKEWQIRYAQLPDPPSPPRPITEAIQRLVTAGIPLHEYTWERVFEEAGFRPSSIQPWMRHVFRAGAEALAAYHRKQDPPPRPAGEDLTLVEGQWIDLASTSWHLGERFLNRERLRPDIAAHLWPLLADELRAKVSISTVNGPAC